MHGEFRENNGGQGFPLSFSGVSRALLGRTADDENQPSGRDRLDEEKARRSRDALRPAACFG